LHTANTEKAATSLRVYSEIWAKYAARIGQVLGRKRSINEGRRGLKKSVAFFYFRLFEKISLIICTE
jgi:hypothetical protein